MVSSHLQSYLCPELTSAVARESDDDEEDIDTPPFIQYTPDDTPIEFVPAGPKISLHKFSNLHTGAAPPEGSCPICWGDFGERAEPTVVFSKCAALHAFHEECLDWWVNESAMANANKCPVDREILCERRERMHPTNAHGGAGVGDRADA